MSDLVTMEEDPRLYLKHRAYRLARLCDLNAPAVIIESEFKLVATAMDYFRIKEGDVDTAEEGGHR